MTAETAANEGETMGWWDVKDDAERERWEFAPLVSVGPLRFGTSHADVARALGRSPEDLMRRSSELDFKHEGVQLYFDIHELLAGIAIDMRTGPQVTLDGTELVARVPSVMEEWLENYLTAKELPFYYFGNYEPGSADLGFILRVQRADDRLLTRPLFLNEAWADDTERIPRNEWAIH
ncbi:hypothetical protein [Nonomuraea sp. NPDC050202]|uniref:hypothetical protein n=1 Tax=Nonomuraea sp. NPDC050202 TaxID=3155035 RepID=UPI0033EF24AE